MSRNMCSTECACGFWKFDRESEVRADSPLLMTFDEYLKAIEWENCPYKGNFGHGDGYGYRPEREGELVGWWSPDGNAVSNMPREGYTRSVDGVYHPIPPEQRYRWMRLECPVCRRLFAGWYVQQPHFVSTRHASDPAKYELYDLSYFYAYNDEPSDRDIENLIEWTPEEVVSALVAWRQREGR